MGQFNDDYFVGIQNSDLHWLESVSKFSVIWGDDLGKAMNLKHVHKAEAVIEYRELRDVYIVTMRHEK